LLTKLLELNNIHAVSKRRLRLTWASERNELLRQTLIKIFYAREAKLLQIESN